MTPPATGEPPAGLIAQTERWFIQHGLPFFIEDRRISRDDLVHGKSLVLLVAVYFGSLVVAVPTDESWLIRVLSAAAGLLVLVVVWALGNLLRHRRALERPSRVGLVEIGVFVLGPSVAVAVLRQQADLVLTVFLLDASVLALVAAAEVFDTGPIALWAVRRLSREFAAFLRVGTRALPMLLLFTIFFFINTEVWQVASALSVAELWLVVALFGVLAVGFLWARLREEVDEVSRAVDAAQVRTAVGGTPIEAYAHHLPDQLGGDRLTDKARTNLLLVLIVSQLAQAVLVPAAVWLFFVVFGVITVPDHVVQSWVGGDAPDELPGVAGLSRELLQVSVFLGGFSGLYFTVYSLTDADYRAQFLGELIEELRNAIGVRAAYRALRG